MLIYIYKSCFGNSACEALFDNVSYPELDLCCVVSVLRHVCNSVTSSFLYRTYIGRIEHLVL